MMKLEKTSNWIWQAVPGIDCQGEEEALLIGAVKNRKPSDSEQEAAAPFPSSSPAVSL